MTEGVTKIQSTFSIVAWIRNEYHPVYAGFLLYTGWSEATDPERQWGRRPPIGDPWVPELNPITLKEQSMHQ